MGILRAANLALAIALLTGFTGLTGCQTIGDLTSTGSRAPEIAAPAPDAAPGVATPALVVVANVDATLAGMSAERLRTLWGEPALKRRDIGSELWQYGNGKGKCSVLLYLYPAAGGGLTVSHAEAVPGGPEAGVVASCAAANQLPSLKPVS